MCKRFVIVILCAMCVCLFSCKEEHYGEFDFFAMDTYISVIAEKGDEELEKEIKEIVLQTEKKLSAHYDNSDISKIGTNTPDEETNLLLNKAYEIAENTGGSFDFTLGAISELWSINKNPEKVPANEEIDKALSHCGYEKISFENQQISVADKQLKIDLGAIAKGYTGDKIIAHIRNNGIKNAAVSLGGNITVTGSSQKRTNQNETGWEIAVNNPFETSEILGRLIVCDATVSVSGNYERFAIIDGKCYHHIFDRTTGFPAESGIASVAVICNDGALADALSTALFVMGYEKASVFYESEIYDFEAVFCTEAGEVFVTNGLLDNFRPDFSASFYDNTTLSFPQFEK